MPAYNRAYILKKSLEALSVQDFPDSDFEVIVVDDGSTDETEKVVMQMGKSITNVKYIKQENSGQGTARNNGIAHAEGEVIIFIQDDIIVKKDFVTEHMRFHLRFPELNHAVLGLTLWHPEMEITPLMRWLTNGSSIFGRFGGHQFAYEKLRGHETADYNFFYTSNISLKRKLLLKNPFDTDFSGYGWEDVELGYRLYKRVGLVIHYNSNAIGYHYHEISERSMCDRMESIGRSAHIIHSKYPELGKVPSLYKKVIFILLSNPLALFLFGVIRNFSQGKFSALYYYGLSKKHFLIGLNTTKTY